MKYKGMFTTMVALLFCFSLSTGHVLTCVYGEGWNPDGYGNMHDYIGNGVIRGMVTSISGSTISILTIDIDASTAEVKLKDCNSSLSIDNIQKGDIVNIIGKMSNGSFVARMINLEGVGELEGPIDAVGTGTITIMGKTIDTTSPYCTIGELAVGEKARACVRNTDSGLTALAIKTHRNRYNRK